MKPCPRRGPDDGIDGQSDAGVADGGAGADLEPEPVTDVGGSGAAQFGLCEFAGDLSSKRSYAT